jgi:uncharacterized membrane protein
MRRWRTFIPAVLILLFAGAGTYFAGVSAYDFILHLDGQVHSVACSYMPGIEPRDDLGTSGCYAVMMSPWSSVMRSYTWAGIPIALPGLAVYLFMVFLALDFLVQWKHAKRSEAIFMLLASLLPLAASIAYYYISVTKVGTVCKLCMGMYISSIGLFVMALLQAILAPCDRTEDEKHPVATRLLRWAIYFVEGVALVGIMTAVYLNVKPAYVERNCGELVKPEDKNEVMLSLEPNPSGTVAIEVLDPLCPACNVFRDRLNNSEVGKKLDIKTVLFPLDSECNWMLKQPVHPGACMVSRAVICAKEPIAVVDWALDHNIELRDLAKKSGPDALRAKIIENFGEVATCIDAPATKTRLNLSLRWIVANSLSILTPQLFVNNRKLCDEDMDLGLEFGLGKLITAAGQQEGGK